MGGSSLHKIKKISTRGKKNLNPRFKNLTVQKRVKDLTEFVAG